MTEHEKALQAFEYNEETGELFRDGKRAGGINTHGYRRVFFDNRSIMEHNMIWFYKTGVWPTRYTNEIDHINNIRDDNRWSNLRLVNRQENNWNCGVSKNNTSGTPGVCQKKGRNQWEAYVGVNYKQVRLGSFQTKEEAIAAREAYFDQ